MAKSTITDTIKKKRGRPALYEGSEGKGAPQIGLRLPPVELAAIDRWIRKQAPDLSRPEAIRRLVELGLEVKTTTRPVSKSGRRLRAKELATMAIDKMTDPAAPPEEQAQRRHRLTKGPTEFREDRVDLPKAKGK